MDDINDNGNNDETVNKTNDVTKAGSLRHLYTLDAPLNILI